MSVTAEIIQKESSQVKRQAAIAGEQLPPFDFKDLAKVYDMNVYHGRCIRLKAALCCLLGYNIVTDEENKEPDQEYRKIEQFLNSHSNYAEQTILTTLYNLMLDDGIFANAFLEVVRNGAGEVAEIYHIPAVDMRIFKDGNIVYAEQNVTETRQKFTRFGTRVKDQNEYLHMKNYSPSSTFYGVPEYIPALGAINLHGSATEYNTRKFENNNIPDTVIIIKGDKADPGLQAQIREFFQRSFKGLKNVGRSLLLQSSKDNASIEVKPIGSETKEASFLKLRSDVKEEIVAAHGVPPRLVGIMSAGQLGGTSEVKEQMRMFRDIVIGPKQKQLEFLLNEFILRQGLGVKKWRIEFETFDISDALDDAGFFEKIMNIVDEENRKVLTSDEIREELGYKPREAGKVKTENAKDDKGEKNQVEGEELVKGLIALRKSLEAQIN